MLMLRYCFTLADTLSASPSDLPLPEGTHTSLHTEYTN
jgi:hypothetical protein